jgi:PHP family Zn ribbon phosphoesterase
MPGLVFRRLDLHVHTPASKCYSSPDHTPEQIVQAAVHQGLSAIAITDHNTAAWIDEMKQAAQGTDLVVFPGIEISLSEGFHVVGLFDPSADRREIESLLGAIDIPPDKHGNQDALCTLSPYELVKKIHERKGLAVLAHIDRPKGAFHEKVKTRDGGKISVPVDCSNLFNEAEYDAVECADGHLPHGFDIVHQIKRSPAYYQASDNPDPSSATKHSAEGIGALHSWFKLDQVDLEGLRQCFADPEMRIRLMGEIEEVGYPKIVSMGVGGPGFLGNQHFEFHGGLNSIIGGKGVGKSLAVEFLRFCLGQPSSDANLAEDLLGKLDKRLEAGNMVEVVYQLADGSQYKIERTYLGKERTSDGPRPLSQHKCTNLATAAEYSGDVPQMFPILAYSQTEVIKIAENKDAQLELIDNFINSRQVEREIKETRALLEANDRELAEAVVAKDRLESCKLEIATLRERIDGINKSLADPLFDEMKKAESKKAAFEQLLEHVDKVIAMIGKWKKELAKLGVYALPADLSDDSDLKEQKSLADAARSQIDGKLEDGLSDLIAARKLISDAITLWTPDFAAVEKEYDQLLDRIGGDRKQKEAERKRLKGAKSEIDKEASGFHLVAGNLGSALKARNELLDRLERAHGVYFEVRKSKFDQLTDLSEGKLRLALEHAADRSAYGNALSDLLKGGQTALSVADRRRISENVAPRTLVQLVLDRDVQRLADEAGISELWAQRAIERLWACDDVCDVLALQHSCYPTDVPSVSFLKGKNQYDELSELSVGQKCTALLIIALCDASMPIVIDQPEDALDIVSVWEDIAKKLRRGKASRQFILTTHNSSVAVSADSDQFIVLEGGADHGKIAAAGAIDRQDVRDAVIRHLEGGEEPYQLRSRKYNM